MSEAAAAATTGQLKDRLDVWTVLLAFIAAGSVLNGGWMLIEPAHWYANIPADVHDTGPFNPHFVRDIGCAFLTAGFALGWAVHSPALRFPLVVVGAFFFVAHAGLHVHDSARGLVDAHHWLLDLPGVYLPAFVLAFAALRLRPGRGKM